MSNFIFEILLEEVPHGVLPKTANYITTKLPEILAHYGVDAQTISYFATPRRFAFFIKGLAEYGQDRVIEQKGPSTKAAYDPEGNPTRALEGFLSSYNVTLNDLEEREIKGQTYLFLNKVEKGQDIKEILPNILKDLISGIQFPQPMRWNHNNEVYEFIRPVRGITAVLDNQILPVEFFGLKSSNILKGHRQLFPKEITLTHADEYEGALKMHGCIPSFEERQQIIANEIHKISSSVNGVALIDDELLSILASLTEYPHPLLAEFDKEFLSLPKEVLISEMKVHQKYVPIIDKNNNLLPYYIITANIPHSDSQTKQNILAGNNRVLTARFSDGRFFFDEDLKKGLPFYAEGLKSVAFVDGAGSLADKVERIKIIAEHLRLMLSPNTSRDMLKTAVEFSKADLCSLMVGEFPELQGIIGAYYAESLKVDPAVSLAIKEHYYPLNSNVPTQELSALVGLADRIDNLFTLYAVGKSVTGSKDPYALRRQTIAIIHLVTQFNWESFSILDVFDKVTPIYRDIFVISQDEWQKQLLEFITVRLEGVLKVEPYSIKLDTLNAILSNKIDKILPTIDQAKSLQTVRLENSEQFLRLVELYKRITNITKDVVSPSFDPNLLVKQEEKELYTHFNNVAEQCNSLPYYNALQELVQLEISISSFFDNVLVKSGDKFEVNRLALLLQIQNLFARYADFSKLS